MRRADFEHVIAAAADISGETEIVVIGSQAILGSIEEPPPGMLISMEADVYPLKAPEKASEIDGVLGDGSPFQGTYGYFAHGVGPETAKAPAGWEERLVRVEVPPRPGRTRGAVALCMEIHDLILAKCVRGDARDRDFAREAVVGGLVQVDLLCTRIESLPVSVSEKRWIKQMVDGIVAQVGDSEGVDGLRS
jgi:hypothetical protein